MVWLSADDNVGLELGGDNNVEQKVKGIGLRDKMSSFRCKMLKNNVVLKERKKKKKKSVLNHSIHPKSPRSNSSPVQQLVMMV